MKEHWEQVYGTKAVDQVSWFRPHLETSLKLIERATECNVSASIVDVGGGASTLVDDLLSRGYLSVTVLDISEHALELAKQRLGSRAKVVEWVWGDVTQTPLPHRSFDVWHDRAVFHFLTEAKDRAAYVQRVASAVRPGGHVIVSTFGPDGPMRCSGLDVVRYDAETLHSQFGAEFELVESHKELHETPFGTTQQFVCCYCTLKLH